MTTLLRIGYNNLDCQLGLHDGILVSSEYMTSCYLIDDIGLQIQNIITSIGGYSIFTDKDYQHIYVIKINSINKITYFNDNKIKIRHITGNTNSETTFFITTKNTLYKYGTLYHEPKFISSLTNIIDIQPTSSYQIALCLNKNLNTNIRSSLINYSEKSKIFLPNDIINIITEFSNTTTIYFKNTKNNWSKIKKFDDKSETNIIKIATGCRHNLFLDSNGVVWTSGDHHSGKLGYSILVTDRHKNHVSNVKKIEYFIEKGIKLKDIQCGFAHNLALSVDGKIYSWGLNNWGQCGHGYCGDVFKPKLIDVLKDEIVDVIKCGNQNSFCKTVDGKHFIWGSNEYGECLLSNDSRIPIQIDEYLYKKWNRKKINDVFLGYFKTLIVCD